MKNAKIFWKEITTCKISKNEVKNCACLKILTPSQMLSKLPILLAQLKAGNNSEKLRNEIRQLLSSFYRSKRFTKQIYKKLVEII